MFGFLNKRHRDGLHTLSEEEIRARLYGSAVAASDHTKKEPIEKKPKKKEPEVPLAAIEKETEEQSRLKKELQSLQKELEETRKRVNKAHGVEPKKLSRLSVGSLAAICVVVLITISLIYIPRSENKRIIKPSKIIQPAKTLARKTKGSKYSIQVAVYKNADAAERFRSALDSRLVNRGYKVLIKKSSYNSGDDKYIVYIGGFDDRKVASKVLDKLKTQAGIKDSFIVTSSE